MKRSAFILFILSSLVLGPAYAEDASSAASTAPAVNAEAVPAAAPAETQTPAVEPVAAPVPAADENANLDNLEFVSGEVGALDEANKSLTIKLYGETEGTATDKTLQVTVDSSTDITDGEQDRDFKSLSVGTEVDVEYDPATNKATYIFVY